MSQRLIHLVAQRWAEFDGWLTVSTVDPMALPIDRFLNVAWFWLTRDADPKEVEKFTVRLWRPPPGVVPTVGPWTPEAEMSSFRALKAQLKK